MKNNDKIRRFSPSGCPYARGVPPIVLIEDSEIVIRRLARELADQGHEILATRLASDFLMAVADAARVGEPAPVALIDLGLPDDINVSAIRALALSLGVTGDQFDAASAYWSLNSTDTVDGRLLISLTQTLSPDTRCLVVSDELDDGTLAQLRDLRVFIAIQKNVPDSDVPRIRAKEFKCLVEEIFTWVRWAVDAYVKRLPKADE